MTPDPQDLLIAVRILAVVVLVLWVIAYNNSQPPDNLA